MKQTLINIVNFFSDIKYQVGFFVSEIDDVLSKKTLSPKVIWIKTNGYKDGWFADPFLLRKDDKGIKLLVEEYVYENKKGRISLLDVHKLGDKYLLHEVIPIWDIDTHLSFPYIFRDMDVIYLCPENYQSGKVILYEFDENRRSLIPYNVIIDKPLVDVQIVKIENFYYAMGVQRINGDMSETRELQIYRSKTLNEKFELFQTIKNTLNEERGAGQIFIDKSRIIRPAQCCEGGYGTCTIFYELSFDSDGIITEREICRLYPQQKKHYGLSLHTFNFIDNLCVVDGHDNKNLYWVSRYISPVLDRIWKSSKNHS